jgi:hypothetical protein
MRQGFVFRLWLLILCWSLGAAAQTPAPSPDPADVERVKESFRIGAAAYAAGEYLSAIAALDSAYASAPLPAIAFSLAQAERRQYFVDRQPEHLQRSVTLFRRYLEQVPVGGRRADAIEALAQLEPLVLALPAPGAPAAGAPAAPPAEELKAPSTRLLIIAEAPGAQVWVDGALVSGTLIRDVVPGKHRVTVRAPGFHDAQRDVVAVAGELIPVPMQLAETPGVVEVDAPPASEIFVDGAFARLGANNVVLSLASGTHRISVAQNGYRVSSKWVDVTRGSHQELSFSLEPTAQRMTSNALLIGGAAMLGAGTLFGVLAVQSEDSAQAFIEKQATENASPGELVRYSSDVQRRNRYRTLSGVSFAASLGMLVTGLFLHELDEPSAEELSTGNVQLAAEAGGDHVFVGVQGAF